MVSLKNSLEQKYNYLTTLSSTPPNEKFICFIISQQNNPTANTSPTKDTHLPLIAIDALASNQKEKFQKAYDFLCESSPHAEHPLAGDDITIFSIICAAKKFGIDTSWLKKLLSSREEFKEEAKQITKTLLNIINDNLESREGFYQLIIVYKSIIGDYSVDGEKIMDTYKKIVSKPFPFYNNDLLNIITIRAFDEIILLGEEALSGRLQKFEQNFIKRVKILAQVISWIVTAIIFILVASLFFDQSWIGVAVASFVGFLGGALFVWGMRGFVEKQIINLCYYAFGFSHSTKTKP